MKRILSVILLLTFASILTWAATYTSGSTAVSIPAGTSATGAGTTFAFSGVYNKYTWEVVVSGGTATAITTNFECSIDGMVTVSTADTSSSTTGEMRSVVNKPATSCRCNITTYTPNGTTAACQFVASADPK
jgi:hypothetical protein